MQSRVVIVTGGAAGIGRATVQKFASHGDRVAIWDVDQAKGDALVAELVQAGHTATFRAVNVTDAASVEAALAHVLETWGRVDVLVNNAGIVRDAQLVRVKDGEIVGTMTDAQFDQVIGVNQKGVFLCTRAVAQQMIRQKSGVVLNASSVVGLYGNFGQTNYVGTKFAVVGMTKVWARELGKYGIRVNAVAPGFIATEILRDMPEKIIQAMVSRTPLGRMGQPEDIANAYYWLASDQAAFVHGAVLSVDGGVVTGT
ncbi:MAG: 3-oxoacyl-ACP reductase FabG [Vicinamibacterales bacterium]|jgi:3-oxoacyl-[acyl-carrier protein] reductase|nr:3-oxoacyl-ACP reductase FabG [Vicinamibacterales bacterium]